MTVSFSLSHEVKVADFKDYIKTLSADSDFKYAEQFEVNFVFSYCNIIIVTLLGQKKHVLFLRHLCNSSRADVLINFISKLKEQRLNLYFF